MEFDGEMAADIGVSLYEATLDTDIGPYLIVLTLVILPGIFLGIFGVVGLGAAIGISFTGLGVVGLFAAGKAIFDHCRVPVSIQIPLQKRGDDYKAQLSENNFKNSPLKKDVNVVTNPISFELAKIDNTKAPSVEKS